MTHRIESSIINKNERERICLTIKNIYKKWNYFSCQLFSPRLLNQPLPSTVYLPKKAVFSVVRLTIPRHFRWPQSIGSMVIVVLIDWKTRILSNVIRARIYAHQSVLPEKATTPQKPYTCHTQWEWTATESKFAAARLIFALMPTSLPKLPSLMRESSKRERAVSCTKAATISSTSVRITAPKPPKSHCGSNRRPMQTCSFMKEIDRILPQG